MDVPKCLNMIKYDKLFALFKEHNITTTDIRRYKIMSESTLQKLRHEGIGLKADNLNHLCALFQCQPNDLFEYVPDEDSEAWAADIWEKLKD